MTIPNLMAKIRNRQYQTAYRKAYSTLNQALKAANEDGFIVGTSGCGGSSDKEYVGENFKAISKYFAGATVCFDNNADKCWECLGEAGYSSATCNKKNYSFIDASGIAYYLYSNKEWPIVVDVNGFSGPNKLGQDRYVMLFTNSFSKGYYPKDVDVVYPWVDITSKQRWCPSGDCPNTTRLFGNKGRTISGDLDNGANW